MKPSNYIKIDHIAIAVRDIEEATSFYRDTMGLELVATPEIRSGNTGMKSAVLKAAEDAFSVVLVQGTEPESQVCRFIEKYGVGVQHPAFEVDCIESAMEKLSNSGVEFATGIIVGEGVRQIFTRVIPHSGFFIELIERNGEKNFIKTSITTLFEQLDKSLDF